MRPGKKIWRIVTGLLLIATLICGYAISPGEKLVTDVFALFTDLSASGLDRMTMSEVVSRETRIVAMRLEGPNADADAKLASEYLIQCGVAKRANVTGADSFREVGKKLYDYRNTLLFPRFLARSRAVYEKQNPPIPIEQWMAERSVTALDTFLATPESAAFSELVPSDPLLLLPQCLTAMPSQSTRGTVVIAETNGPATDKLAQNALHTAVQHLRSDFSAHGTTLTATGAIIFSQASEAAIRKDIVRLNIIMLVLLLAVMFGFLRSIPTMLSIAFPVLLTWLLAILLLFVSQHEVYAFALAIGGILGGITVDYPMHVMLHKRGRESTYVPSFRRVFKPMTLGALSSILVFLFLIFSDISLIRQAGILVSCALAISYLLILPCFSAFPPSAKPETITRTIDAWALKLPGPSRYLLIFGLLALAFCSPLIRWNDATDTLQPPLLDLYRDNDIVLGNKAQSRPVEYVVSFGDDISQAIVNARSADPSGMANLLSTKAEVRDANEWVRQHGNEFRSALEDTLSKAGYDSGMFQLFFAANLKDGAYEDAMTAITASMPAGCGWMYNTEKGNAWMVSAIDHAAATNLRPEMHTYRLDVREQLREAFRNYRIDTMRLAVCGFAVASVLILLFNGLKRGLKVIAIPTLSILATLGGLGILRCDANLFTVTGLLLGYGLSMDYALFVSQPETGRASIRFSAYTTIAAFAGLGTSTIPALRSLGISVLLVLLFTLLQCEAKPLISLPENESR